MQYGLLGEKLGHSYSKEIHELFGFYPYELREIPRDELDAFMEAKDFKGVNVTIPYKEMVIPHLDYISEQAKAIGAVNTVVNKDGRLFGYNTDFSGLKKLIGYTGHELKGAKVLILGTGGTSKTARAVCASLGAAQIIVVSRSGRDGAVTYEQAAAEHADADFIVNTTPAGMYPKIDATPIDLTHYRSLKGVVDVVYNPMETRLMREARALGIRADGGLRMLVYQAVAAVEYFVGETVPADRAEEIFGIIRDRHMN